MFVIIHSFKFVDVISCQKGKQTHTHKRRYTFAENSMNQRPCGFRRAMNRMRASARFSESSCSICTSVAKERACDSLSHLILLFIRQTENHLYREKKCVIHVSFSKRNRTENHRDSSKKKRFIVYLKLKIAADDLEHSLHTWWRALSGN